MTTTDENKETASRLYGGTFDEVVGRLPDLVTEDSVLHDPVLGEVRGRDEFAEYYRGISDGMADARITVDDLVAEGDEVTVRWTFDGTHEGPLPGFEVEPTGEEVTFSGIDVLRFEDGKIAETWSQFDSLGFLQQIGVVPSDATSSEVA